MSLHKKKLLFQTRPVEIAQNLEHFCESRNRVELSKTSSVVEGVVRDSLRIQEEIPVRENMGVL